MSDFDFDEIDRAVNNAIGTDGDDTTTLVSTASTPAPVVDSPVQEPASPTVTTDTAATPTVAPAARRSSGRFMDVVHPSSDMRATNKSAGSTRATIAPLSASGAPVVDTPTTEPAQTSSTPTTPGISEEPALIEIDTLEDWRKPLESPFIADAKVEKRPLGGDAPSTIDFDALELLEAPDDPKLAAHAMPDPIDFAQLNTIEASEEVVSEPVAIKQAVEDAPEEVKAETSVSPSFVEDTVVTSEVLTQETSALEALKDDEASYGGGAFQSGVSETPVVAPQSSIVVDETPAPIGPASISQQYQEKPSSSPEPGAIYDTEAYHQPLAIAPKKKKSGVWVVLWILLIVLLGGGAGAAFYFYVLPLL